MFDWVMAEGQSSPSHFSIKSFDEMSMILVWATSDVFMMPVVETSVRSVIGWAGAGASILKSWPVNMRMSENKLTCD